ncbi:nucleoside 2-deoxyribosyltransferase [Bradyrhizobium sp. INPA03-11B]|uniref:nucleoside 2-deoxyribosyltransferase n=1 Tax=Bradyrhizobium sp. INPA03-11B TaxID=418598 RepID=UPI00338DFC5A
MISNRPCVYLAAPLFSDGERASNRDIARRLSGAADVFVPQDDGLLLVDLVEQGMQIEEAKRRIFQADVAAITRCDVLVIVMDGRSIDEGASFELGYAYASGKVCVGLKTDVRSLLPIGDNPMIECAVRRIFRQVEDLAEWLSGVAWKPS